MELDLLRTYYPKGTNGSLLVNGVGLCHTIELPWKNNEQGVSCIPEGTRSRSSPSNSTLALQK
jgi:hypothetical protein